MGFGCLATATDSFGFYDQPLPIAMCVVTVDTSGHMLIAWEKNEVVNSYNIYRLVSTSYQLIGNVPYSASSSYYDQTVNPSVSAYRYKVSANHAVCNNEGPKGFFHGSIHITTSTNPNGGYDLTITDPYLDESGVYSPSQYYILIDSANNGTLEIVDSMSSVFNSYYIQNPVDGSTYTLGVSLPYACDITKQQIMAAKGSKATGTMALSNKSSILTGIGDSHRPEINIKVFPNPSDGIFHFEGQKISSIGVFNAIGEQILTTTQKTINLSSFEKGVYYATVQTANGPATVKLIVQ
jgi:hypothetical protein